MRVWAFAPAGHNCTLWAASVAARRLGVGGHSGDGDDGGGGGGDARDRIDEARR